MSPNRMQLFMLLGVSAITLHFTIMLGVETARYLGFKQRASAHVTQWEIVNVKDRFALKADYEFNAQEKNWQGSFTLNPPYFLNEMSALESLKGLAKMSWSAWYKPNNPKVSALEKSFPRGLLFRALTCYGVLIYFLYLTKRVVRV